MKPQDTQISINRNFLFGICDECASNSKNLIKVHIVGYGLTQNDLGFQRIIDNAQKSLSIIGDQNEKGTKDEN